MRWIVVLTALALAACTPTPQSPEARFDAYLNAAAGGDEDRGWSYLDDVVRELSYDNDPAAYIQEAENADWDGFRWDRPEVVWTDDGIANVQARVLSTPGSVPAFLILNGIVHGVCEAGDASFAIGVFTSENAFELELGGGGMTGSQKDCNSRFVGDASYPDWR
jgi:hypothetical protein